MPNYYTGDTVAAQLPATWPLTGSAAWTQGLPRIARNPNVEERGWDPMAGQEPRFQTNPQVLTPYFTYNPSGQPPYGGKDPSTADPWRVARKQALYWTVGTYMGLSVGHGMMQVTLHPMSYWHYMGEAFDPVLLQLGTRGLVMGWEGLLGWVESAAPEGSPLKWVKGGGYVFGSYLGQGLSVLRHLSLSGLWDVVMEYGHLAAYEARRVGGWIGSAGEYVGDLGERFGQWFEHAVGADPGESLAHYLRRMPGSIRSAIEGVLMGDTTYWGTLQDYSIRAARRSVPLNLWRR